MVSEDQNVRVQLLSQLLHHSAITAHELISIANLPHRHIRLAQHQELLQPDHVWIVEEGCVARFGETADGGRQLTRLYFPGDIFGLCYIILPSSCARFEAIQPSWVQAISVSALRKTLKEQNCLIEAIWRHAVIDSACSEQWLINIGRRGATARIAHLICEIALRHVNSVDKNQFGFSFPLTQLHLADATGITPVYVNRVLMKLRSDNIASVGRGWASILDFARLQDVAEFDPRYLHFDERPMRIFSDMLPNDTSAY